MLFPVRGGPSSSPCEPQAASCSTSRGATRVMTKCNGIKNPKVSHIIATRHHSINYVPGSIHLTPAFVNINWWLENSFIEILTNITYSILRRVATFLNYHISTTYKCSPGCGVFCLCMYVYVFMVTHIARVWINRVRLPILHVVSWTGKMNISLSAFVPENLVSRDGFGSPVPRQPTFFTFFSLFSRPRAGLATV